MIARCGLSGMIYDFHIDGDSFPSGERSIGATGDIVLHLCSTLPEDRFFIYVDRFYTSFDLLQRLQQKNVFTVGTIMANRLRGCPVKTDRELQRGEHDEVVDANSNMVVVKWMDRKAVLLCSNFVSADPIGTCKRFSRQERRKIDVACPSIVQEYSRHMGGVDLFDMLKGLYSIDRRGNKFYFRLCHYLYSVCCVNAWLLYRRHTRQRGENHLDFLKFTGSIAETMTKIGQNIPVRRRGRPSHSDDANEETFSIRRQRTFAPQMDVRFDGQEHWPCSITKGRCMKCHTGNSRWQCSKCKVRLCLNTNNNCFTSYHLK